MMEKYNSATTLVSTNARKDSDARTLMPTYEDAKNAFLEMKGIASDENAIVYTERADNRAILDACWFGSGGKPEQSVSVGDIVRFSKPVSDDERRYLFMVSAIGIDRDINPDTVNIVCLNSGMAFQPQQRVARTEIKQVAADDKPAVTLDELASFARNSQA